MQEVLYISAPRYDLARSAPLPGQGDEEHAAWLGVWAKLGIEGLHGFPLWEGAVHDFRKISGSRRSFKRHKKTDLHGYPWTPMDIHRCLCMSMHFHGCPWLQWVDLWSIYG